MDTTASILVVDDQTELLDMISMTLEAAGYHVLTAADGSMALEVLQTQSVNLILADIAMPRLNGYQLYERVRVNPRWLAIPFIFLTSRAMDSDIRYGKELGVDDYLTKPIQPEDLLAAIHGRLRRAQQLAGIAGPAPAVHTSDTNAVTVGPFHINFIQHRAWMDGQSLQLSAKEFTLLEQLTRRAGGIISARELIRETHGLDTDDLEAGTLLRPLVRSLRRKLGYTVGEGGCIENVRGIGYRLAVPEQ